MWQLFKNMKKYLIFGELKFQKSTNNFEKVIKQFTISPFAQTSKSLGRARVVKKNLFKKMTNNEHED